MEKKKKHHLQYPSRNFAFMGSFDVIFLRLVRLEATRNTGTCLYGINSVLFNRSYSGQSNGIQRRISFLFWYHPAYLSLYKINLHINLILYILNYKCLIHIFFKCNSSFLFIFYSNQFLQYLKFIFFQYFYNSYNSYSLFLLFQIL